MDDLNKALRITVTGPTAGNSQLKLKSGDVAFSTNGTDWSTDLPTNAGNYQIKLTTQGEDAIKAHYGKENIILWTEQDGNSTISSEATFKINPSANVVSVGGTQSADYTGQPINVVYNASGANSVTVSIAKAAGNTTGATASLASVTLESGDFQIVDASGQLTTAKNAGGVYHIVLTSAGVAKIQNAVGDNYAITQSSSYYGTLVINKATEASATLSGTNEKVFDGTPVTTTEVNNGGNIKVTLTFPGSSNNTYELHDGDYKWNTNDGSAPTNKGNYTITLTPAGLVNLQNAIDAVAGGGNVTLSTDQLKGSATFEITPQPITDVVISGDDQSKTYDGQAAALNTNGLTISGTGLVAGHPLTDSGLTAADFDWYKGNTKLDSVPVDAGQYEARLKSSILTKLQNDNPNYHFTAVNGTINYTINPAATTVTFGNSASRTYNGQGTSISDALRSATWTPTGLVNGQTAFDTSSLTAADYGWFTKNADGSYTASGAPTNVGTYYLRLMDGAITKIKNANPNYSFATGSIGGEFTYTITQANASGKLAGSNSRTYNGHATTTAEVNSNGQIVVTVNFPGANASNNQYTLRDGDYTWNTTGGNAPTDAGDYQITLTTTGISNIENYILGLAGEGQNNTANVTFADTDFTGSAKYTINKAAATATIGGNFERTYNGQAASGTEVYGNITWTGHDTANDVNFTLTHPLSASDYAWYTNNGNGQYVAFTGTPINAGTYYLMLNPEYATNLDQANPNYEVTLTRDAAFTYTIDKATATAKISGSQESNYNGHPVTIDSGKFPVSITTNNGQTITAPSGAELTAADVVITDSQGRVVTNPTKIDTYTIKLSPAGLQKFESQADNYDWVSAGTGTLSILRSTDTSVKLAGNESVVYTGQLAVIDPTQFHVTLGNGETYTLQDGDLQFVDQTAGANTNAGQSYQVELSDQGRRNIAQIDADNYGYDFTKAGTGSVTVTKATPSATMAGTAEKNYDGTPISGYLPTITITAPGNNSVTLTSGDFEWIKDGHTYTDAPSDAGTYTVSLTSAGLAKVKAVNSQNLDWSNVQVTGTGSYKIDKANAMITLPSGRTETITWNGNPATIDPSQFVPTVTSDNPNAPTITLPSTLRLTASDYQFLQGGRVIAAPSEVGTYQVQLTENGWHKVRDAIAGNTNYNWTYQGEGTYNINKATATITLNGSSSTTYTGSSAVIPSAGGTVTGITVTLSNGQTYDLKPDDLEFVNARGQKIDAPTDAGTYKVRLTSTAVGKISGLAGSHYDYTYDNGTVDFTINKATANVSLSQTQTSSYTGAAISPAAGNFAITITTNNGQTLTYDLQSGDVATAVSDPTNVGSYDVVLTDAGKDHIKGLNANYNYHFADSHGTLEITQARATATLSGAGTRAYNVSAVTVDDLNRSDPNNNITLALHYPKNGDANYSETVQLTADDFVWNTPRWSSAGQCQ